MARRSGEAHGEGEDRHDEKAPADPEEAREPADREPRHRGTSPVERRTALLRVLGATRTDPGEGRGSE